jgi:hypothetical protein
MRYNHFEMLPELAFRPILKRMTLEGGGGGGGKSTTQQGIDPLLRPYVDFGLTEAQKLYQTDSPEFYGGQTFVSPSQQTQQALMAAQNRAMSGNPLLPAAQQNLMNLQTASNVASPMFSNIFGNAQTSPQLSQDVYSNLASGQMGNAATPLYSNIFGNAQTTPQLSQDIYSNLARGQMGNIATPMNQFSAGGGYLGSNPFFTQALQGAGQAATQTYNDAITQAQSGASRAGRFGSNVSADIQNRAANTLANTLANKAGELAFNQYGMERGLQEAAMGRLAGTSAQDIQNQLLGAQQLAGAGQQALQNQLSAAGGIANTSAQNIANQLAGAQQLSNVGQQTLANQMAAAQGLAGTSAADLNRQLQAVGAAPSLAEADYGDINKLLQVGQAQEEYGRTALDADIERFNFEQNKPYAKLQTFLSGVYGAPQGSVSTTQQSGGKIVCTAMNHVYGFGSFRQKIWLAQSKDLHPAYEKGYHSVFMPIIFFAYGKRQGWLQKAVRASIEHIARHRTADIWKQKHGKRDTLGRIYRTILEPICYLVGKVKGA